MRTVWLVHGIRQVPWGRPHLSLLRQILEHVLGGPWSVEDIDYGYILIPVTNARAVNAVREKVRPGDVVIAYSNGAWAAVQAMELGTRPGILLLLNPALHVGHQIPPGPKEVHVFYDEADFPTRLARCWRVVTGLLPWRWQKPHGWGAMGRYGYQGVDPRVQNHNLPGSPGHQAIREPVAMRYVAAVARKAIRRVERDQA